MHKVFISYHHDNDQDYKDELLGINRQYQIFTNGSVDIGDIDDSLSDERIREKIRDEYLKDTSVTVLLVGSETAERKHIDWELYSSMYDGNKNKKSGILVINLPTINCYRCTATHDKEKEYVHPEITSWDNITTRSGYKLCYPYMPDRILDNLIRKDVKISVVSWDKISNSLNKLSFLINATYNDRASNNYDLSSPLKRSNS